MPGCRLPAGPSGSGRSWVRNPTPHVSTQGPNSAPDTAERPIRLQLVTLFHGAAPRPSPPQPSPHYACLRWCLPRASQALLLEWRDVDTCWGLGVTMQPISTVHSTHVTGSNQVQVNYNNSQDFFFFA